MRVHIGPYQKWYPRKRRYGPPRKISVKLDRWDSWAAYETIGLIVTPLLKQLRKSKHGAPFTDDGDVPKRLRSRKRHKNTYDTDANLFRRWDWILGEMIWAFEQLTHDFEKQYHHGKVDFKCEDLPDGSSVLKKGPKDTHRFDRKGYTAHCERIENGLMLFAKYALCLWD